MNRLNINDPSEIYNLRNEYISTELTKCDLILAEDIQKGYVEVKWAGNRWFAANSCIGLPSEETCSAADLDGNMAITPEEADRYLEKVVNDSK